MSSIVLTLYNWRFIIFGMTNNYNRDLATTIKRQRISIPLTLRKISSLSGVSRSHLARIERGERFPSASILRKIAKPLGFDENELFTLAGYLYNKLPLETEGREGCHNKRLDTYVANVLAQEPAHVQRAIIGILIILKSLAQSVEKE